MGERCAHVVGSLYNSPLEHCGKPATCFYLTRSHPDGAVLLCAECAHEMRAYHSPASLRPIAERLHAMGELPE